MKVLFLDIDGVLQPRSRQERFNHLEEIPAICDMLNETKNNGFDYKAYIESSRIGIYDIGAVYFDWDRPSVERLQNILETTGARIVLSSDWRESGLERMVGMLGIYDLDSYLHDSTYYLPYTSYSEPDYREIEEKRVQWGVIHRQLYDGLSKLYPSEGNAWFGTSVDFRTGEIREYLDRHPEVTAFVAIDDRNLTKGLNGHFVHVNNKITEEEMQQCIDILNIEDGPYPLEDFMHTPELKEWREKGMYTYVTRNWVKK